MQDPEKIGLEGAKNFLKSAVEARRIRDELESFGEEDLARVARIANGLGYTLTVDDLKNALHQEWAPPDIPYLNRFCLSEPPGF